jgi:hypothetical protein
MQICPLSGIADELDPEADFSEGDHAYKNLG